MGWREGEEKEFPGARRASLTEDEVTQKEGQTRGRKDSCESGAKQLMMSWNKERKKIIWKM